MHPLGKQKYRVSLTVVIVVSRYCPISRQKCGTSHEHQPLSFIALFHLVYLTPALITKETKMHMNAHPLPRAQKQKQARMERGIEHVAQTTSFHPLLYPRTCHAEMPPMPIVTSCYYVVTTNSGKEMFTAKHTVHARRRRACPRHPPPCRPCLLRGRLHVWGRRSRG